MNESDEHSGYTKDSPFLAPLSVNVNMCGEGSGKETRHFEISLDGSGMSYEPGDSLGVIPTNCPSVVAELLNASEYTGDETVNGSNGEGKPLRKLQNQYPDEATARKAAETELKQRTRGGNTLQLTMPGRPEIVAEGRLTTGGFPDGANQEWLVTEVSHRITPRGYTSGVQAEQP